MPMGHISLLKRFPARWRPVRVKKTRQIKESGALLDSVETERLQRLPLVGTSPPAVVRFKYDNRSAGQPVPSGAKERVPDAGKNEDGKAEADDQQRKH
jgi:hypothetical protein